MTRLVLLFAALTVAFAAPSGVSAQGLGGAIRARQAQTQTQPQPQPQSPPPTIQRPPEPPRRPEVLREVSMGVVISNIQRRTPGSILNAIRGTMGGRPVITVRWTTEDGRRIDYLVDAQSGDILSANGG